MKRALLAKRADCGVSLHISQTQNLTEHKLKEHITQTKHIAEHEFNGHIAQPDNLKDHKTTLKEHKQKP